MSKLISVPASEKADLEASGPLLSVEHEQAFNGFDTAPVKLEWLKRRDYGERVKAALLFLLPTFVQARIRPHKWPARKLHPTSHLDGMRGLAAFLVVCCHMIVGSYNIFFSYGGTPGDNRNFFQLPIVCLVYHAVSPVAIFFVVSGYSLSIKPIKQMRAGQDAELHRTIASSAFRRPFRLFLPCVVSMFMILCYLQLRFYRHARPFGTSPGPLGEWRELHWEEKSTLWQELVYYYHELRNLVWIWNFDLIAGRPQYDHHLCMILFLCQAAFALKRPALRMALFAATFVFFHQWGRWEVCLFIAGAVLCELDMILATRVLWHSQASPGSAYRKSSRYLLALFGWGCALIVSLFLMSYPYRHGGTAPAYRWLTTLIPKATDGYQHYWPMWGAILYALCINNVKLLSSFFTLAPIQYLGRISFSLYLVHGGLHHTWGYTVQDAVYNRVLHFTPEQMYTDKAAAFHAAFFACAAFNMGCYIWVADIFMRVVDAPSVKFARWLDEKGRARH